MEGTDILLESNTIYNGDDCLMLGGSAYNVVFRNTYCNGGHGLSIGSLGKGANSDVKNITYVILVSVVAESDVVLEGLKTLSWWATAVFPIFGIYLPGEGKLPLWSEV